MKLKHLFTVLLKPIAACIIAILGTASATEKGTQSIRIMCYGLLDAYTAIEFTKQTRNLRVVSNHYLA